MNRMILKKYTAPAALFFAAMLSFASFAASPYLHDPMKNPSAAKDIVEAPEAVYGYAPSPDSTRMKAFLEFDWTNAQLVEEFRRQREDYHESIQELYGMIRSMKAAGNTTEEIARAVSTRRNEIRLESYRDDPEGLEKAKQSNLETFGNENGGTPDYFYAKYGSWETVIEKALSVNAGADAILGLYDKYYDTYFGVPESTYVVQPGDSLTRIAEKMLGDGEKWRVIRDLNRGIIRDPDLIYPGQVLKIA